MSVLNKLVLLSTMLVSNAVIAAGVSLPPYEQFMLGNGARVMLMEKHDVPLVSLHIRVAGGALLDPPGKNGSLALLAELMQKGAGSRDARSFAEAIDGVGGNLQIGNDRESLQLSAQFMSADTELMVALAADALLRPQLQPAEFAKVRERAIQTIIGNKDSDPRALTGIYGESWLFRGHPYGQPVDGDETTLAATQLDDLIGLRGRLGADQAFIAVVGSFKSADMKKLLEKAFGQWPKAQGKLPDVAAKAPEQGRRVLLIDKPGATQSYFWLGNVGVTRLDPNLAAQNVANTVFGGRFTSMINTELRIKSGLSYGAGSRITRYRQPGAIAISSFTQTDSTGKAMDLALETLDRLHKDGIAPAMRDSAVNYVLGQYPPNLETGPALAAKLTELGLYGLGREDVDGYADRINAVDADQLGKAIAFYPTRADMAIVIIGDAAKLRETAARFGPVTEMKITDPRYIP
jgi:predicted Zn-dependent peptidase